MKSYVRLLAIFNDEGHLEALIGTATHVKAAAV